MRTVAAVLLCAFALAGCGPTAGPVQVEGQASQVTPPPVTPPPPTDVTLSVDPVALLRTDPKVSDKIKSTLTPCMSGRYPVDARYVDVTKDGVLDLLVAVAPCEVKAASDAAASGQFFRAAPLANYVYDLKPKPPVDIFASEEPGQLVDQRGGLLQLIRWEYRAKDESCCPSLQTAVLYQWTGTAFEVFKK
jgi:hypothetical protein